MCQPAPRGVTPQPCQAVRGLESLQPQQPPAPRLPSSVLVCPVRRDSRETQPVPRGRWMSQQGPRCAQSAALFPLVPATV